MRFNCTESTAGNIKHDSVQYVTRYQQASPARQRVGYYSAAAALFATSPVAKPHIFGEPCNTVHITFFCCFYTPEVCVLFKNLNDATE